MTIEEIYSEIAQHMVIGMMIHEHYANYYYFLNLDGYKTCHEYHFYEETYNYRCLCNYYMRHHNKLIKESKIIVPEIIPSNWYQYTREDVGSNTIRESIKSGLEDWIKWEQDTKTLYTKMYKTLMETNEVADACFIKMFICDVDNEIAEAQKELLQLMAINFDMPTIMAEQSKKTEYYTKEIAKILC